MKGVCSVAVCSLLVRVCASSLIAAYADRALPWGLVHLGHATARPRTTALGGDRLSVLGWGVKASWCVCACGGGCLGEGVARWSWMTGGGLAGWGAPWTPCLIWARGCQGWRPVT